MPVILFVVAWLCVFRLGVCAGVSWRIVSVCVQRVVCVGSAECGVFVSWSGVFVMFCVRDVRGVCLGSELLFVPVSGVRMLVCGALVCLGVRGIYV